MAQERRNWSRIAALACILAAGVLALAACGGDSDDADEPTPTSSASDTTPGAGETAEPGGGGGAGGAVITVELATASAAIDQQASVELRAPGIGDPGLGAWTFEITYDPTVVSIGECIPPEDVLSFCNTQAGENAIRLTGASAEGLSGDATLATITFTCEAAGESELAVSVETFADATIGDPRGISTSVTNGSITCG